MVGRVVRDADALGGNQPPLTQVQPAPGDGVVQVPVGGGVVVPPGIQPPLTQVHPVPGDGVVHVEPVLPPVEPPVPGTHPPF
jgi:hypothetical protein